MPRQPSTPQQAQIRRNVTLAERLQPKLAELVGERDGISSGSSSSSFPGFQYVVVSQEKVMFSYSGGRRNVAEDRPVSEGTRFMMASTSKALTSIAALQMIEDGTLKLDESVSTYYPDHPYGRALTIRHLLMQTSGIANPPPCWFHSLEEHAMFDEEAALQRVMENHPRLLFPPGFKYSYSNIASWLLQAAMERQADLDFPSLMKTRILDKLGIPESELGFIFPVADAPKVAKGYIRRWSLVDCCKRWMLERWMWDKYEGSKSKWLSLSPFYLDGPGYGGAIATARGVSKVLQDLLQSESRLFTDPATKDLLFTRGKSSYGHKIPMSLGLATGSLQGERWYGKPGGGPGYSCSLRLYPDMGFATVWMGNNTLTSHSEFKLMDSGYDAQQMCLQFFKFINDDLAFWLSGYLAIWLFQPNPEWSAVRAHGWQFGYQALQLYLGFL
ncbi:hypothetical protein CBR_g24186 [Chara braunii]|uniref:Beta-lactamase-related domain-containing protein n=1 Tax=Chara braunii TaxID=69332 RepID=A0A388L607_CHABU|nr:hypothetical protein CBR_g24186 [Chara braunii]|eukprot:GBG77739.1 hypothetical protein CBR_g24186 [Chara braunii]